MDEGINDQWLPNVLYSSIYPILITSRFCRGRNYQLKSVALFLDSTYLILIISTMHKSTKQ